VYLLHVYAYAFTNKDSSGTCTSTAGAMSLLTYLQCMFRFVLLLFSQAEKLAKDPLRYVLNPSMLELDQAKEEPQPQTKEKERVRTGFNKRLLKNEKGVEQCFEEARAGARCFQLAPSFKNFNLLHGARVDQSDSQMDIDEDVSSEDVSMADSSASAHPARPPTHDKQPRKFTRLNSAKKAPGRVLFKEVASFDTSLNQTCLSTASSTVDEAHAVGIATGREEETINTKFAMKELSMMFSSPGVGLEEATRKTEQYQKAAMERATRAYQTTTEDGEEDASFDNIVDLVGHITLDNSILVADEGSDENNGPRNPLARTTTARDFEQTALRELEGSDDPSTSLDCLSRVARRPLQSSLQDDSLRSPAVEFLEDPGFPIFEDDDDEKPPATETQSTFAIFEDGDVNKEENIAEISAVQPSVVARRPAFEIFEANERKPLARPTFGPGFAIFQDEEGGVNAAENSDDEGDTATLSLFGDIMQTLDDIQESRPALRSPDADSPKPKNTGGFEIFADESSLDQSDNVS
jgi:hypothetical protein